MESGKSLLTSANEEVAKGPCQYLEWDSQFFQRRIARVRRKHLTTDGAAEVLGWCREHEIDCLYFLAAADDPPTIRIAEQNAFHFVDTRVTFERSLEALLPEPSGVRAARPADLSVLAGIASRSFSGTRFYNDSHFTKARCDELYAEWITKCCNGDAARVLVVEHDGIAAGFVTCSLAPSLLGSIGLIAVDSRFHGRGMAGQLIASALHFFRNQGMSKVSVVTQGQNITAQRLYQRCGFLTGSLELWYHHWFSSPEAATGTSKQI